MMFKRIAVLLASFILGVGLCPALALAQEPSAEGVQGASGGLTGQALADGPGNLTAQASPHAALDDYASYPIRYFKYLNKSKTQAVGITGDLDGGGNIRYGAVWYVKGDDVRCLYSAGNAALYKDDTHLSTVKGGKIFKVEQGAYGSGSTSYAWFIRKGTARQLPTIGLNLLQVKGNQFSAVRQAFDSNRSPDGIWTGHTYNAYYYKWNGKKFIEYGGKAMSVKQFKKAKNGVKILKAIKRHVKKTFGVSAQIGKIYYRANGVVNVNYSYKQGGSSGKSFANVKLRYKSGRLSYMKVWSTGSNPLARAMQGGWYKARGGSQDAGATGVSYPKRLPARLR